MSEILSTLKSQCVQYMCMLLQGLIEMFPNSSSNDLHISPLLHPVLLQTCPRGFLHDLVAKTHTNQQLFSKLFSPLLQGLFFEVQRASLVGNSHRRPIEVLEELIGKKKQTNFA